ncbi:MAG: NHLP family bacteriocin export ABC transporter peptidase/permease/ATPase subunit [Clostridiales bacterium]|jgi:NHLM bacteriocin system ABC transporter peptidase/ATP-binding protein|nr:NHLP family bacteriocin export ABC transporter peptidase/permease/ATPase subunit [Clostridiales bacterium]
MKRKHVKVPVVMQMENLECGAACLSMILAYYGKWMSLEENRADCGVSRDGAKAKNIVVAARAHGLDAKGYRFEPGRLMEAGAFPCILHWNFNHFVVCTGMTDKWAYLNDPAKGEVRLSREEFDKGFTGVCILFKPTPEFVKGGKPASVIDFAKKRLKGTRSMFAFLVTLSLLGFGVGMIQPAFGRVFMDVILPGKNPGLIPAFLGIMAAATFMLFIIQYLQAKYLRKIEGKLAVTANASFIWHVLRLPAPFFAQRQAGELLLRQSANEGIAGGIMNELAPFVINCAMAVLYLVIMLRVSVTLSVIGLGSLVINMALSRLITKKSMNLGRMRMREMGMKAGAALAGIQMIETLKASGAEDGFFERWAGYQAAVNAAETEAAKLGRRFGSIPAFVMQISNIAVLITGIYLCFDGNMTVGLLFAFQSYLAQFTAPAQSIISLGNMFTGLRARMERVEDVMMYKPDVPDVIPQIEKYDKLRGNIELKDVSFGYSRLEPPIIEGLDISVKPGQHIALVGASGCGKSTIAKLITGLYEPWSGAITYDGKPRSAINRNIFTSSVASVDQDIVLFGDTISNNIKLWDNSIEDFEMIMAARDGKIHETVMEREGGYGYRMAEGGADFSGGQRQRLEIARALAGDPTVIVLDEATSALDAKTEFEVSKAIKDRGITCVIVAHRLSTIRDCDEIIVLDRGRIAERGTHDELYKLGGKYTALVTSE